MTTLKTGNRFTATIKGVVLDKIDDKIRVRIVDSSSADLWIRPVLLGNVKVLPNELKAGDLVRWADSSGNTCKLVVSATDDDFVWAKDLKGNRFSVSAADVIKLSE